MRVALDVPLPRLFDYALPEGASVASGDRVTVQLGRRNHTGVVIDAEDAMALLRETAGQDRADVAEAEDRDVHVRAARSCAQ